MGNHAPLFSFHSIFDIDIGLVYLIKDKYLSEKVFDVSFFSKPKLDIIKAMYTRSDENPLTVFAKPGISKEDLDDYYTQFLDKEYEYIYENCVYGEVINFIDAFSDDNEINPSILCYNDYEVKIVKDNDVLKSLPIIRPNDKMELDLTTQRSYSEVFVKKVKETDLFIGAIDISMYISSFGPNFDRTNTSEGEIPMVILSKFIESNAVLPMNTILVFDMYNPKYFIRKETE